MWFLLLLLTSASAQPPLDKARQATELWAAGQPESALAMALEAADELENQEDLPTRVRLDAMKNAAFIAMRMGRFEVASDLLERSEQRARDWFGEDSLERGSVLDQLGQTQVASDNLSGAVQAFEAALAVSGVQADARRLATVRVNLMTTLLQVGRLDEARALAVAAEQALDLLEGEPQEQSSVLGALAELYQRTGDSGQALRLHRRAYAMLRPVRETYPGDYAIAAANLGLELNALGDDAGARLLLAEAHDLLVARFGAGSPDTARVERALVSNLLRTQRFEEASTLAASIVEGRISKFGAGHPATAGAWHTLAQVRFQQGRFAEALALEQQAVDVYDARLGPTHERTVRSRTQLAYYLRFVGRVEESLELAEMLIPQLQALGRLDDVLNLRAEMVEHQARTDPDGAALAVREVYAEQRALMARSAASMVRRERVEHRQRVNLDLGLLLRYGQLSDQAAWEAVLSWKADDLYASRTLWARLQRRSREPEVAALLEEQQRYQSRLARLLAEVSSSGPASDDVQALQERLLELEVRAKELVGDEASVPTADQICGALAPGEVLVDMITYRMRDEQEPSRTDRHQEFFVVSGCGDVVRIELGEVEHLRSSTRRIHRRAGRGDVSLELPFSRLSTRLLAPLWPHLQGAQHLWLATSGRLAMVPWAALTAPDGRYLVEHVSLSQVLHGGDLLRERTRLVRPRTLLVGDVDYGSTTADASQGCLTRGGALPLPATRAELDAVRQQLSRRGGRRRVTTLSGAQASEAQVRELAPQVDVLHLATHGYWSFRECVVTEQGEQDLSVLATLAKSPLTASGVLLAGVNQPSASALDDGLWTGEEVLSSDLSGVELAVLSACESGMGDMRDGANPQGLSLAMDLAGVKQQVLTLWSVDDLATAALIPDFYASLVRSRSAATALRDAQLTALARARASGQGDRPDQWGAFILVGR